MMRVIETVSAASFMGTMPRISLGLGGDARDRADTAGGTGSGGSRRDPRSLLIAVPRATTVEHRSRRAPSMVFELQSSPKLLSETECFALRDNHFVQAQW